MWYRIELHKDGTARSCVEVSQSYADGRYVRYVEASTHRDALKLVRAWYLQQASRKKRSATGHEPLLCRPQRRSGKPMRKSAVTDAERAAAAKRSIETQSDGARKKRGLRRITLWMDSKTYEWAWNESLARKQTMTFYINELVEKARLGTT
jgi:hypothetical protein